VTDIDLKKLSEAIPIEQVDFRVQSISKTGWAILLAYKDARVDQDRLDYVVGQDNWEKEYELIDAQLFCKVGIWSESKNRFVWKQDVGVESTHEKEKGRASDAFKRACFNWGIGRELYDYPLILVKLNEDEFYLVGDKAKASFKFHLKEWIWHCKRTESDEQGKTFIETLKAIDEKGGERFSYLRGKTPDRSQQPNQSQQSSSNSSQPSGVEKDWYNTYDDNKGWFQKQINSGKTPTELLATLQKKYKVNKKTVAEILALKRNPQTNS